MSVARTSRAPRTSCFQPVRTSRMPRAISAKAKGPVASSHSTSTSLRPGGDWPAMTPMASASAPAHMMANPFRVRGLDSDSLRASNILGGGSHAGPGTPDIQEVLVCPIGSKTISEALETNFKVHKDVRILLEKKDKNFTYGRGDEGAWAPNVNNDEAVSIVAQAVENAGLRLGKDIALGIDFASSSLWDPERKIYDYSRQGLVRKTEEQIDFVQDLIKNYHLIYVEDPVNEDDFESMASLTKRNNNCFITGDDMLVTSSERVNEALKYGA